MIRCECCLKPKPFVQGRGGDRWHPKRFGRWLCTACNNYRNDPRDHYLEVMGKGLVSPHGFTNGAVRFECMWVEGWVYRLQQDAYIRSPQGQAALKITDINARKTFDEYVAVQLDTWEEEQSLVTNTAVTESFVYWAATQLADYHSGRAHALAANPHIVARVLEMDACSEVKRLATQLVEYRTCTDPRLGCWWLSEFVHQLKDLKLNLDLDGPHLNHWTAHRG